MLESGSLQLERLVASAADLISSAKHRDDRASSIISSVIPEGERGALPPPCREPYCGGFHWNWKPPRPPRPLTTQPFPDLAMLQGVFAAGEKKGPRGLAAKEHEFDAQDKYPHGSPALIKALEQYEHLKQRVLDPRLLSKLRKLNVVSNDVDPARLDYYEADFFPALHGPVAKQVRLLPGPIDNYPTWLADRGVELEIKREDDVLELTHHLNDFLRVTSNWVYKGKEILPGQRLLAVLPKNQNTMLAPYISKEQLLRAGLPETLPVKVVIGGKPAFEKHLLQDAPVPEGVKEVYPAVPVKRLDIVLRHKEPPGSPHEDEEELAEEPPPEKTWMQKLWGRSMSQTALVGASVSPVAFREWKESQPHSPKKQREITRAVRRHSATTFLC